MSTPPSSDRESSESSHSYSDLNHFIVPIRIRSSAVELTAIIGLVLSFLTMVATGGYTIFLQSRKTQTESIKFHLIELQSQPNNIKRDIFVGTVSAVLASTIVGSVTFFLGKFQEKRKYEKAYNDAPKVYVQEIDKLIDKASADGISNVRVNARAIVTARNNLRESLESISQSLNSEIDRLEEEINNSAEQEEILETINTLYAVWPSKKQQIDMEVRKALTELGIKRS